MNVNAILLAMRAADEIFGIALSAYNRLKESGAVEGTDPEVIAELEARQNNYRARIARAKVRAEEAMPVDPRDLPPSNPEE